MVDSHVLIRSGMRALLEREAGIQVRAEAGTFDEALAALRTARFDVIVADIDMPGGTAGRDAIELIDRARTLQKGARFIVLTMRTENAYAARALKAGADGYVTKDTTPEQLLGAIRKVASGAPYLSPAIAESLALRAAREEGMATGTSSLSKRELTVFNLLAQGKGVREIAEQLTLSSKTVSAHKVSVLRKMNLRSASELVRFAMENDLVCRW